ncbi:Gfo/Idh/MocA family oxidoreductase [Sinomonas flava]|uniref:Gfo/Idh/MocA family protein n=1 Tax=Sinomonas flava TaxID=496857 RepID=UPI0039A7123C
MTWRLRKETAGSGALGDIASHAIGRPSTSPGTPSPRPPAGSTPSPHGAPAPTGPEDVTVDDAAWATLSLASGAVASVEVSRAATGRKNSLRIEAYGSAGAIAFDLERLGELEFLDATAPAEEQGFRRIVVTEPGHPYAGAWWPRAT